MARELSEQQLNSLRGFLTWLDSPKVVESSGNFFKAIAEKYVRGLKNQERYPFDVRTLAAFAVWINERLYSDADDDEYHVVYFSHNDYPSLEAAVNDMVQHYQAADWESEEALHTLNAWAAEEL